jgi:hypothetical protein
MMPKPPFGHLTLVPNYPEDRAATFPPTREPGCLPQYQPGPQGGDLSVSFEAPPDQPLSPKELMERAARWRPSTRITLRCLASLWAERSPKSAEPAYLARDEILEALGRERWHGAWRERDVAHLLDDLRYLECLHLRGSRPISRENKRTSGDVDAPYYSVGWDWGIGRGGVQQLEGVTIGPGPWYGDYLASRNVFLMPMNREVFRADEDDEPESSFPERGQSRHDRALYLHLAGEWRIRANARTYATAFVMRQLLAGAGIDIDRHNGQRFARRISQGLQRLVDRGWVGSVCGQGRPVAGGRWFSSWLRSEWEILPPEAEFRTLESWTNRQSEPFSLDRPDEAFTDPWAPAHNPDAEGRFPQPGGDYSSDLGEMSRAEDNGSGQVSPTPEERFPPPGGAGPAPSPGNHPYIDTYSVDTCPLEDRGNLLYPEPLIGPSSLMGTSPLRGSSPLTLPPQPAQPGLADQTEIDPLPSASGDGTPVPGQSHDDFDTFFDRITAADIQAAWDAALGAPAEPGGADGDHRGPSGAQGDPDDLEV